MSSIHEGRDILLDNRVEEQLGHNRVTARLEGEGHGEVYQTGIWVIALGGVKLPDSSEMIKYFDITADSGYEERFQKIDVTGVGEVEEWLEPNNEVG